MVSIGPTFGVPLGLGLFDISHQMPFIAAAIAEITVVILGVFLVPETVIKMGRPGGVKPTKPKKTFREGARTWLGLVKRRGLAVSYFGTFYTAFIPMSVPALTLPLYATFDPPDGLGLTASHLSLIYLLSGALRMVLTVPGGALSDRVGRKWPIVIATFVDGFVWLSYPFLTPAIAFSGILALRSVDTADDSLYSGPMTAYMMEWAGRGERGRVSGINELFRTLGTGIGVPLLGAIAEIFGMASSFYYASAVAFVSAAVIMLAWVHPPKPKVIEALPPPPILTKGTIMAISTAIIFTLVIATLQLPGLLTKPAVEVTWSEKAQEYPLSQFYVHTAVPPRVVPTVVESAREKAEEIARQTDSVIHLIDVRTAIARLYWEESQPGGRTPGRYPTMEIAWAEVREVEELAGILIPLDWSDEAIEYHIIYQSNITAKVLELESGGNMSEFRDVLGKVTEKAEDVANATDKVVDVADLREAIATILQEQYPDKYPTIDEAWTRLEALEEQVGYTPVP
jgi:hypothetical protein